MSKAEDRYLEHFQDGRLRDCSSKEAFLLGYHQAEKDLDVVSWVKEVSGVKELSRAKEEALKAYPPRSIAANYDTINRRDAFEYGYLKAEKDLELTWEDIDIILNITDIIANDDAMEESLKTMSQEEYCKEVLKRFKKKERGKGMNLKIWSVNNVLVMADTREDAREAYFAFERDYDYDDIP